LDEKNVYTVTLYLAGHKPYLSQLTSIVAVTCWDVKKYIRPHFLLCCRQSLALFVDMSESQIQEHKDKTIFFTSTIKYSCFCPEYEFPGKAVFHIFWNLKKKYFCRKPSRWKSWNVY